MNGLPYYPRYPRDFFDGTNGMSFEVKGAYAMLLDLIYMCGGHLYDEPRFIAGHMNCSVRAWGNYRAELISRGKIKVENGIISNFRADKELIIQRSFQDKQRINGSQPKKNKDIAEAVAKPKASHTDTHTEEEKSIALSRAKPKAERFEEFWEVYPHRGGQKRGKKPAGQSYERAVAKGIPEQLLIDAAKRSAMDKTVIDGFARDPATWLNQEGWADEIQPTTAQANDGDRAARLAKMAKIAGAAA